MLIRREAPTGGAFIQRDPYLRVDANSRICVRKNVHLLSVNYEFTHGPAPSSLLDFNF